MNRGLKYIMAALMQPDTDGTLLVRNIPLVFPDLLVHADMAKYLERALHRHAREENYTNIKMVSAGFISMTDQGWKCYGKSESLRLASRSIDAQIISEWDADRGLSIEELTGSGDISLPDGVLAWLWRTEFTDWNVQLVEPQNGSNHAGFEKRPLGLLGASDEVAEGTPGRRSLDEDPFAALSNKQRSELPMGNLTDDELANGVYLHGDREPNIQDVISGKAYRPIVWLTAAKERMRWLSRRLRIVEEELAALKAKAKEPA